jgi:V-type H+-transporting ATPase subunit a
MLDRLRVEQHRYLVGLLWVPKKQA